MLSHHIIAISFETIVDRWRLLHEIMMLSFTLSFLVHVSQSVEGQEMPYPTRIGWFHCLWSECPKVAPGTASPVPTQAELLLTYPGK